MSLVDDLKAAVGLGETEIEVSWVDRMVTAVYVPPSGTRISFDTEDVSKNFEAKGTAFEFPNGKTYVQSKGPTSWRMPLNMFYAGAEYDFKANVLEEALREGGRGKLEHPFYGTHDVVVLGNVQREDRLVTAGNQSKISCVFWASTGVLYPEVQDDAVSGVEAALAAFNAGSAAQFATQIDTNSAAEEAGFLETMNDLLDTVQEGLNKVAAVNDVINNQFNDINDSIQRGLDVLIGQPLTLAFQTKIMIQAPARALDSIQNRLEAYGNLASDIFGGSDAVSSPGGVGAEGPGAGAGGIGSIQTGGTAGSANDSQSPNLFHTRDMFASTYVTGSVLAAINNDYVTKTEAIETAEAIIAQFDECVAWRDENYTSLSGGNLTAAEQAEFIQSPQSQDSGGTYSTLQDAVALCVGYLIQASFDLKQETFRTLDRDRNIVELCAEIYGHPDEQLDFFIKTNALSGSEIIELPKGTKIVYYV